jgi:hypothetical protein
VKKEQIEILVIAVGAVLLIFFVMSSLKKTGKKPAVEAPAALQSETAPEVRGSATQRLSGIAAELQSKRWELPWARDPFLALSENVGKMNEFQLKGISFSGNSKGYAFINEQIIPVGGTIGDYEVAGIEKDKVMLRRGTQTFFLTFTEPITE